MQFDVQRAFPYPVLRPYVDDYLDGDSQAIVDVTHPDGSDQIHLDAQFALSVDEIASLVRQAQAKFVLVVSCRDTLHQRGDQICYRLRLWKVSLWQLKRLTENELSNFNWLCDDGCGEAIIETQYV